MISFQEYFLSIAEVVKTKSKDISTQIGAVIVGEDNEIVSTGYNSFPRGINDDDISRQERPEKYFWFVHAEQNAIFNAARIGVSTKDCTIYLTCGIPCVNCAQAIIQCGITIVVCKDNGMGNVSSKWDEHYVRSLQLFKEAGIQIKYYK